MGAELLEKEKFIFAGNRPHLRMDDEMARIDRKGADLAFKKYKKQIMDGLLLKQGFSRWKSSAYVRRNRIGLLEYLDLQKERYGSKTFCVNFAAMPLYCGYSWPVMSMGDRLGVFISGKDVWWDYCDEKAAEQSFENAAAAVEQFVLPWFQEISSEKGYRKMLAEFAESLPELAAEWLDALELKEKEPLIQSGIQQLKLPKKLSKLQRADWRTEQSDAGKQEKIW